MYTGYIYTIVFDSNFVIIAVRKKYQKKKDEWKMNLKAATFIFINILMHLIIILFN